MPSSGIASTNKAIDSTKINPMVVPRASNEPRTIARPSNPRSTHLPIWIANSSGARAKVAPTKPTRTGSAPRSTDL